MSNLDFCGECGISIHSDSRYCSKCQAYIDMEAVVLRHTWSDQEALDSEDLCEELVTDMEKTIESYQKIVDRLKDLYIQGELFSEEEAERLFGTSHGGMDADDKADPIYCNERRC